MAYQSTAFGCLGPLGMLQVDLKRVGFVITGTSGSIMRNKTVNDYIGRCICSCNSSTAGRLMTLTCEVQHSLSPTMQVGGRCMPRASAG